jgi:hypothetical protein
MTAPHGDVATPPGTDWRVTVETKQTGWAVRYTLLIDPGAKLCARYLVGVFGNGEVLMDALKLVYGSPY